jgi:hypothetical protein
MSTPTISHSLTIHLPNVTIRNVVTFTKISKFEDEINKILYNHLPQELINHINSYVKEEIIVCSTDDDGIIFLNSSTGEIVYRIETLPTQVIQKTIISQNGKLLVYFGYTDYEIGDEIDENGFPRPSNNILLVWNLETNQPILRLTNQRVTASSLSFDNKYLVFASSIGHNMNRITIMNLTSNNISKTFIHESGKYIDNVTISLTKMIVAFSYNFTRPKIFIWSFSNDTIVERALTEFYTEQTQYSIRIIPHIKTLKFIKDQYESLFCETDTVSIFLNTSNIHNVTAIRSKSFRSPVSSTTAINASNDTLINAAISYLSIDITKWSHKDNGENITFTTSKPLTKWISNLWLSHDNKSLVFRHLTNIEYYKITY